MSGQWLDWGDHTRTVDPLRSEVWITDGKHHIHKMAADRGADFDAREVSRLINYESRVKAPSPNYFLPSSSLINSLPKFAFTTETCHRPSNPDGKLPSISTLLYNNELQNKSTGEIEAEMREANRRQGHRLHSRDGWVR